MKLDRLSITMLCCMLLCSCATLKNANTTEAFEKSVKTFHRMLRWQEIEAAGMLYIAPELRESYAKTAESIKKRGVSITDYRILASECIPEKGTGDVLAEFGYFALPSNRVKTLTYRQEWVNVQTEQKSGWQLKSPLPEFD